MRDEPDDFDDLFPNFDPASFGNHYPSMDDFPFPYWDIAMRRVYDYELYQMASHPAYSQEMREVAREAWAAIEQYAMDAFVCDLAGRLLDCSLGKANGISLEPATVSAYLSVMLWTAFREPGGSLWLQHVLHVAIDVIGVDDRTMSAEQAFAAGWAAGLVDGELGDRQPPLVGVTPTG